ncbi:THUMP domain-containing class I SAM-dependent RNA methyltransferase [Alkalibacter saccharofermentans]|uniref:Putative N6-adenine-specific DNA methylase n=1 Tax=Alkalibacter saccharofermentans DSM 14828 TaxID=1120975 RepID=A0A1M4YQ76_9FIRM|nr:class I SAM-dependent RNA methyltransferase [Alkalibacter saccharofermentans]SHF07496.1 putative N6-adenine-specific DNA methylase [Alkalibacter saccharofermentans DSM 14828]
MKKFEIIATCTFGLESVLKREIAHLGFEKPRTENGRVVFTGTCEDIAKANISLRTADRVLVKVGEFESLTFDDLYEKTKALPWENWIGPKDSFPVAKATSVKSKLFSKSDCQKIVKKAIVDRLRKKYHIEWFEEIDEKFPVHLSILKDVAVLSIDTSGSGLNKRGYRAEGNEAPIKETLAAALVLLSGWRRDKKLVDPFCGSGTLLIEAALYGLDIKPGISRSFISETWSKEFRTAYSKMKEELSVRKDYGKLDIQGWDLDKKSLKIARQNAKIAGVEEHIEFVEKDARDLEELQDSGIIVANPPYGDRLLDKREVENLYQDLGRAYKKTKGWSFNVITGHLEFERHFKIRATKNRKLYNGNLLTYFYQYLPNSKR